PIMMTTMAAMLGGLPLALGMGTGSEMRRPLGITIVGGLIVSQALTLFTTPVIYLYLDRLRLRMSSRRSGVQQLSPVPNTSPGDYQWVISEVGHLASAEGHASARRAFRHPCQAGGRGRGHGGSRR